MAIGVSRDGLHIYSVKSDSESGVFVSWGYQCLYGLNPWSKATETTTSSNENNIHKYSGTHPVILSNIERRTSKRCRRTRRKIETRFGEENEVKRKGNQKKRQSKEKAINLF
eukprot:108042_1